MTPCSGWAFAQLRRLGCAIAAAALLAGCMPLLSERPAGDAPYQADAFWEGSWVPQSAAAGDTPAVSVRVKDAARGELELVWLEQDGKQIEERRDTVVLQRAGPVLLASVPFSAFFKRGSAQGEAPLYAWARIERIDAERIAISVPSMEGFRPHLGDQVRFVGKQGTTDRDAAVVKQVPGDLLQSLQPGEQAWEPAVVYRRLPARVAYPLRGL